MKKLRIVLADDHEIFRAGLKSLIDREAGLEIVGQASDGEQLIEKLPSMKCDLIVLDLSMPKMDGMAALKILRKKYADVRVLVLTMQKDYQHFQYAMNHGAWGYMLKDDAYEQLVMAIKVIMNDKRFVSPVMTRYLRNAEYEPRKEGQDPSLEILTKREKEILKLVAQGEANKNIATKLKISIRTVETHRSNMTNKLNIKTTASLVKYALSKGLI